MFESIFFGTWLTITYTDTYRKMFKAIKEEKWLIKIMCLFFLTLLGAITYYIATLDQPIIIKTVILMVFECKRSIRDITDALDKNGIKVFPF
jgi:hypothetical protein